MYTELRAFFGLNPDGSKPSKPLTNADIEALIHEKGGENVDQLLFGMRFHLITPKQRREFISAVTRAPNSGGHQKVKAKVNEALEAFHAFIKANIDPSQA